MTLRQSPSVRILLALVLVLVVHLAGMGRALATASAGPELVPSISGVVVTICHTGNGSPTATEPSGRIDCCDECALCAAVAPPVGVYPTAPSPAEHVAAHAEAIAWTPIVRRLRSPRVAQAPPQVT